MSAPIRTVGMIGIATGKLCRLTVAELCFLKKLLVQDFQSTFAIVSSDEARNPNLRRERHVDWNFLSRRTREDVMSDASVGPHADTNRRNFGEIAIHFQTQLRRFASRQPRPQTLDRAAQQLLFDAESEAHPAVGADVLRDEIDRDVILCQWFESGAETFRRSRQSNDADLGLTQIMGESGNNRLFEIS